MQAAQIPISQQLGLVQFAPVQDEFQGSPGEEAGQDIKFPDPYRGLELAIHCMKMGRRMLINNHADEIP